MAKRDKNLRIALIILIVFFVLCISFANSVKDKKSRALSKIDSNNETLKEDLKDFVTEKETVPNIPGLRYLWSWFDKLRGVPQS